LAASVAHELNNIAASLFGFVELAAEQVDAESPLLGCLGEIRIGVARVTNLAAVLEALSEVAGSATRTEIIDCVGGSAPAESGDGFRFQWECDPATVVDADPDRVRRAIRTLTYLRKADTTGGADLAFQVSRAESASQCSFCGAVLPAGSVKITLIADDVRLFDAKTAGARRRAGMTFPELVVTGSAHATHMAGGHVALDPAQSTISLVLSAA